MNKRTLLLISYIYPPSHYFEIAGQRPFQFAKHLPSNGWRVIVLTRFWDATSKHGQHALPNDMPTEDEWDAAGAVHTALSDLDKNDSSVIQVPFQLTKSQRLFTALNCDEKSNFFARTLRKTAAAARDISINRTGTTWLENAKVAAELICQQKTISCVMATAPPADTLLLGRHLSKRFRIPWIADLRDQAQDMFESSRVISLHLRRIAPVIRSADASFAVSDELCESEMKDLRLPKRPHLIPNGFDPSEYPPSCPPDSSHFEICYTGSLHETRRVPDTFLHGLKLLFEQSPELRDSIVFRYMGRSSKLVSELAAKFQVDDILQNDGHVDRADAIRCQTRASALLHLTDSSGAKGIATGKIYEYFAAGRPILAVPGDNSTADRLIRSTNTGEIAGTPTEVARVVSRMHEEWRQHGEPSYTPSKKVVNLYDRAAQARQVAQILDKVCLA